MSSPSLTLDDHNVGDDDLGGHCEEGSDSKSHPGRHSLWVKPEVHLQEVSVLV